MGTASSPQRGFAAKYSGNLAGFFWGAGSILQLVFGLVALSPRMVASSIFSIASPCSFMLMGHKNAGVVMGCVFGGIAVFLAVYPEIIKGEIGSLFGFITFCVFVSFAIFSAPLTRRFHASQKTILRKTLGHPRRLDGLGTFFLSRAPIVYEGLTHDRWPLAAVFAVWGLGDLAFCFSEAE